MEFDSFDLSSSWFDFGLVVRDVVTTGAVTLAVVGEMEVGDDVVMDECGLFLAEGGGWEVESVGLSSLGSFGNGFGSEDVSMTEPSGEMPPIFTMLTGMTNWQIAIRRLQDMVGSSFGFTRKFRAKTCCAVYSVNKCQQRHGLNSVNNYKVVPI